MTQTQTEQQQQQQQRKTISKRRSFSAWLRRKVTPKGSVRKVTPREGVGAPFTEPRAVFGVPLVESIQYARQTISYQDEDGTVYRQAGAIPTVVAKCGLFLKSNALQTEGIFRLSGSLKRVAALQETFNKPSYGVSVDWEGLTVHDAATLFRRYLNQLPDPVIIHEYYQPFRDVMNDNSYDSIEERIDAFQILIGKLPLPHQQLLLYLLDMLNLFARHSEDNRMDASNLAAVFCPAVLSHPSHNTPVQYKISQRVIEFLIEFQALFTMQMVVHNSKERSNSVSSDGAFVGKGDDGDNVPPVPVLPDWVGATFIAQRTVPPLDMETVHRGGGTGTVRHDHGISPPLDSGTDVKTPAPFHVKDSDGCSSSDDGDGIPTPRRLPSPPPTAGGITASSLPASPWSVSQEQQPLPGSTTKSLSSSTESTSRDSNVWTVLHEWNSKYCKGNPMSLAAMTSGGVVVTLAVGYVGYQAMTFRNLVNVLVFFGGLAMYGMMLMQGVNKTEIKSTASTTPTVDVIVGDEDMDEDPTIVVETLMAQDRATEEAIMKDESLMAEWGDLMNRSWRTDPSTPSIMRRNSSSDSYFATNGAAAAADDDDDDEKEEEEGNRQHQHPPKEIDQASMLSISSRFNEEQHAGSSSEEDFDDDDDEDWTPPNLGEEELQRLWHQFQQVEKDKDLAEKLQREEDAAERKRDEATNPFLASASPPPPISPRNTDQEAWKIATPALLPRPQK